MDNFKIKINKGFTLIELMVAISIFTLIMMVSVGALITTSHAAKKAQALSFTMDNLSFAMESMTRSLRMGTNYYCSNNPTHNSGTRDCNGDSGIAFVPAQGNPAFDFIMYRKYGDKIQRYNNEAENSFTNIVSDDIKIIDLNFFVRGSGSVDNQQPSVYIFIKGEINVQGESTPFSIQTMVSQRTLDY